MIDLIELESGNYTHGGPRAGSTLEITYTCPCGKGKVYYESDDTIGFKYKTTVTDCVECEEKYSFSKGKAEIK